MAPEALSSEVFPASDVWAAGVMAYQLLSGYLPFDDARNRDAPALSQARAPPRVGVPTCQQAASCHASLLLGMLGPSLQAAQCDAGAAQVWKAILTQEPQFRGSAWAQVSDDAKSFVRALLEKCGFA